MNFSDYGYEQARPAAERFGLSQQADLPQMSYAPDSGGASPLNGVTTFRTNLVATPQADTLYAAEVGYRRPIDMAAAEASTNATAMGISNSAVDAAMQNGARSPLDAAWYAAKVVGYDAWNLATGGFVARHDQRVIANAAGQLSDGNFWRATAVDGATSVASIMVAGGTGKFVAGRLGGYSGAILGGAAAGASFDLTQQAGQNLSWATTNGESGQSGVNWKSVGDSAAYGALLGGGAKILGDYGNYNIQLKSFEPGTLYSNPLPFDLVDPAVGSAGAQSPVDVAHAIGADYTKAGRPTGGHSLLNGDVRIVPGTESIPDATGVYNATVQVPDPKNPGQWLTKTSNDYTNSMFPKHWDAARIQSEVDAAWNSPDKVVTGAKWSAFTPSGVKVEGFISPRTTVYPLYQP